MKALIIGTDASALSPDSPLAARLRSYAANLGAIDVLVLGRGIRQTEPMALGGSVTAYDGRSALAAWSFLAGARHARKLIALGRPDVISAQDPFECGRAALIAARRAGIPLHVQLHTDMLSPWFARDSLKNRIRAHIADRVLPRAQGIRVVSERIQRSLIARYGSRIPVPSIIPIAVPMPGDQTAPLPPIAGAPDSFPIIAVARLEREKRVGDILEAFSLVWAKHPDIALYVVGSGREMQALMARAKALGIENAVAWLGYRADAPALMRSARAFIQASSYEGYGMALVEAALARLPIVTTDVGIAGSVFTDGKDALIVPVGDAEALTQALARVVEEESLRASLGSEAAHTARNHLMANMAQPQEIADDLARAAGKTL